ncbi:MAG: hypothetical protein K6B64_03650 [Acholeplasmatales bacterium]|nr:hypothetical protein [Acholeplasmatales bacterium]
MKKFISVAAVAALGILTAVSCNNDPNNPGVVENDQVAQKVLKSFIFAQENKSLTENFTLPAVQAYKDVEYKLTWTSDSSYIQVAQEAVNGVYAATVTRPTDKRVDVKLTVTLYASETDYATAEFIVHVGPYTVYEVCDAFKFAQNKATVYSDFELPTTTHYADGVDATIAWEVVGQSSPLALEGNTVKVTPQENRVKAQLKATFTFNGETTSKVYDVTVFHERTPEELFYAFYDEATVYDEAFTVYGYVTAKAGYNASYGDGYLYVMDQTKLGGYYIYYAYCSQEVWDSLEVGTRVKIPGCVATIYNGLYETTNSKDKQLEVITDDEVLAPLTADELNTLKAGRAVDNQVVTGQYDLAYQTGNIVNLTSWKVTAVASSPKATAGAELLTLEKDGVQIKVVTNKYTLDLVTNAETPTASDQIITAVKAIKVNDYVNVKGILYNTNNAYIIAPVTGDCVTKTTNDDGASTAAAAKVVKAVKDAKLSNSAVVRAKDVDLNAITLPDGVTLDATLVDEPKTVTIENGVIKFQPTETPETVKIVLTATDGTYTYKETYEIYVKYTTDEEMVAAEKEALKVPAEEFGVYELPLVGETFDYVNISWVLNEGNGIATLAEDGKTLTILSVDENTEVKLTATLTCNDKNDTKEVTLTIKNKSRNEYVVVDEPDVNTQYVLGLYQGNLKKYLFATGEDKDNKYLLSDSDVTKAMAVSIEKSGPVYSFRFANGKYVALNGNALVLSDTKYEWTLDATTGAWYAVVPTKATVTAETFEAKKATLFVPNGEGYARVADTATFDAEATYYTMEKFYFGTYNKYDTFSASNINYAATSFVGHIYKVNALTKTKQQKCEYEASKATLVLDQASTDSYTLPTDMALFEDVKVSYAVKAGDTTGTTITEGVITFGEVAVESKVTVVATYTCNGASFEKEFEFTIAPLSFDDVTTVVENAKADDKVFIQGIVDEIASTGKYVWITDGVNRFEFYNAPVEGSVIDAYSELKLGQRVSAIGTLVIYNETVYEFSGTTKVMKVTDDATDDEKALITANELALPDIDENVTDRELTTKGTIFSDVSITWSAKQLYTTTSVNNNKLTVVQGSADEEVILVAEITSGAQTLQKEVKFTVKKESLTKTKTIAYTSSTSVTLKADTADNDFAADLGLDTSIFDIKFTKNSANYTALYAGSIRLYGNASGGNVMTISCIAGYRIDKVVLKYDTSKTGATGTVNTTEIAAISTSHTTDTVEFAAADAVKSVAITNTSTSQFRIASIEITYTKVEE